MSHTNIHDTTIIVGPTDKVAEAALELAEAARVNAAAILEIAKALRGPEQATGIYIAGDHHHTDPDPRVWRGEGFFGTVSPR